jgi:Putative auto-transporter adhesin, head GIN domain
MKKIFLILSMGLCVNMSTTAQTASNRPTTFSEYNPTSSRMPLSGVKEIDLPGVFQEIEIRGNITVILTNEPDSKLLAKGSPKDLSRIKTTLKDRKLLIDAQKKISFSKLTIYIPVTNADLLVTNGQTEIFSLGTIKSDLKIILNGDSRISVDYTGKLKILPGKGYELVSK